jgi:hypothetical protein
MLVSRVHVSALPDLRPGLRGLVLPRGCTAVTSVLGRTLTRERRAAWSSSQARSRCDAVPSRSVPCSAGGYALTATAIGSDLAAAVYLRHLDSATVAAQGREA